MAAVPENLKFLLFGMGPKFHATVAFIMEILAFISLVLGIICAFQNDTIGIWSTEWFLIAIALFIWGLWAWLCAYVAAKE